MAEHAGKRGAVSEELMGEGLTEKETFELGTESQEGQPCGDLAEESFRQKAQQRECPRQE